MDKLVCTGLPAADFSHKSLSSFLAISELGYSCFRVPLLLATLSAVHVRLMALHFGRFQTLFKLSTCSEKALSSAFLLARSVCNLGAGDVWLPGGPV